MVAVSMFGRLAADTAALRARMEVLARQVSDGRKGTLYGDIAPEAKRAIDLRADIAMRATYQGTIDGALGRTGVAQEVLGRLEGIASEAMDSTLSLPGTDSRRITVVAQQARAALEQVAQLLNTRHAGECVFGGSDFLNAPVPNAQGILSSGLVTQIAAAVAGLAPGGAAAVSAATLAAAVSDAPGTTPFSAFLSSPATGLAEPRRGVPAEDGARIEYGLFANRNAAVASAGATTGSWARDLLRGLATLSALDPSQVTLGADFQSVVADAREALRSATQALGQEQGLLGGVEQRLTGIRDTHAALTISLRLQLSSVEEVDAAGTIASLQATRTQLEASYQAIASIGQLSLARFLA